MPSVDNQRCSSAPQDDNHDVNSCGIPSSYEPHDITDKPIGEHENNKDALADDPQQLNQDVSGPAHSEGQPLLNGEQPPSVAVVDSVPDSKLYLETDISHSAERTQASVRQISPTPLRHMAAVTHGREHPEITKPPRRKSFEVAQARILERRNPRCRDRRNVAQHDHRTDWSGHEEGPRLTKRCKRAPRPVGKVANCTSCGPFGKSLHSSASAQSAKPCYSQDIFGHGILTVETHALGTAYFFSFEPNSPNKLDALQFRFPLGEPHRLAAPSSTRGSKHVQGSKKGRLHSKNDIHTTVTLNTIDEGEWEVEQILASRIWRGKLQYQARWKGCDADPTWYPASGFKGAPYKIQNFHGVFLDQPGPPRRLTKWLEAWEAGHDLEDVPDDDLPE